MRLADVVPLDVLEVRAVELQHHHVRAEILRAVLVLGPEDAHVPVEERDLRKRFEMRWGPVYKVNHTEGAKNYLKLRAQI